MDAIRSSSLSGDSSTGVAGSGIGSIGGDRIHRGRRRLLNLGKIRSWFNRAAGRRSLHYAFRGTRRKDFPLFLKLLLPLLYLKLADFRFDLRFEFVGSTLEFVQRFSDLARNSGQFLRPKQQEGQYKQNCCIGETHALIITEQPECGNAMGNDPLPGRPNVTLSWYEKTCSLYIWIELRQYPDGCAMRPQPGSCI